MTQTTFLVLAALAHGPQHGYGICRVVRERTHGAVTIVTIYPTLKRLERTGYVEGVEPSVGTAHRRYQLLPLGGDALRSELARQELIRRVAPESMRG